MPVQGNPNPRTGKSNRRTGKDAHLRKEERLRVQVNPKISVREIKISVRETQTPHEERSPTPSGDIAHAVGGTFHAGDQGRTARHPIVAQRDPYPSHSATLSYMEHLKIIPRIITRQRR